MANAKKSATKTELPERLEKELATSETVRTDEVFTSVKHLANLGDIVSIMPSLKKYFDVTTRRVKLLQVVDFPGQYYPGAVHPTTSADGTQVCVNQAMFDMIKPLVESQEYIHSFEVYSGQHIDLDFDVIRGKTNVNMPHQMIQGWIPMAFPDLACDLSKPWIFLNDKVDSKILKQVNGKIIVNFTERYRNHNLDYFFLKNYAPDLIFAGTETEYFKFCNKFQLTIPRLEISNFLEYAYALKRCRFTLSNQSFCWNLAQGMHVKRILEVCSWADNCQPFIGEDSYGFFYQVGLEYYFRLLFNKTLKAP